MSSRGPSSQKTALGPVAPHIPWDLSCLVLYEPLRPNYNKQPIRVGTDGGNRFWAPPNRKNAYIRDKASAQLFRWIGGRMTNITAGNPNEEYSTYAVATIFTQWPDTTHLLAVTFDAEKKDVAEENGGWKVLSFDYVTRPGIQGIYSSVSVAGGQQQLAAPGSPAWIPQLLPKVYDYDPTPNRLQPVSGGLIGNLALLFALPAFSAQPSSLSHVLTSCGTGINCPMDVSLTRSAARKGLTVKKIKRSEAWS
ncbi:MAG: hypothetical protein Q9192_002120 [Flavoplaca navasiana]